MTVETHFYLNEERRLVELTEQPHSRQALRKLFASDAQEKVGTTKAQRTPRHKGHQGADACSASPKADLWSPECDS